MASKKITKMLNELEEYGVHDLINMSLDEFADVLINKVKIIHCEKDLKLFILEYLPKAFTIDRVEAPIRYFGEEDDPEEVKEAITSFEEQDEEAVDPLTDRFIQQNFTER